MLTANWLCSFDQSLIHGNNYVIGLNLIFNITEILLLVNSLFCHTGSKYVLSSL